MIDWPKKSHWRTCTVCRVRYECSTVVNSLIHLDGPATCVGISMSKATSEPYILQKMGPGAYIDGVAGNSSDRREWFMKKELKEFLPYMVETLGAELAKDIYMEAFERYQGTYSAVGT